MVQFNADLPLGAVIKVDADGVLRVVSGFDPRICDFIGRVNLVSTIPLFPKGLDFDEVNQDVVVASTFVRTPSTSVETHSMITEVNTSTGERQIISGDSATAFNPLTVGPTRGLGPPFQEVTAIAAATDGTSLLVTERTPDYQRNDQKDCGRVTRINRQTGNRTLLAGCDSITGTVVGTTGNNALFDPTNIAVEDDGQHVLVVDASRGLVVRLDQNGNNPETLFGLFKGAGPSFSFIAGVAEVNGAIFVADQSAILRIEANGDRTLVSGVVAGTSPNAANPSQGTGPEFVALRGITTEPSGTLVVADLLSGYPVPFPNVTTNPNSLANTADGYCTALAHTPSPVSTPINKTPGETGGILRVNVTTGARQLISGPGQGSGEPFFLPRSVAVEPGGALLVVDVLHGVQCPVSPPLGRVGALIRVNPSTGERTVLSGWNRSGQLVGDGPPFQYLVWVAVDPQSGKVFVVDIGLQALVQVEPTNGKRTIIADATTGSGNPLTFLSSVTTERRGCSSAIL